ncbi:kinase [Streptomyces sp. AV19]|uniref:aminoglycoside phosphotransferase family protein n=1 Tax=Streptomyces sp. AV19 TaxID=2793068 RepID=UPI0018FE53C8|nr:aminoglycoside phosphotransferase family protein [Streptomyces sp. AV19]MBH1934050.1 kinase [Streptomyces sp. AV19]MDG4535469.1 aminoglycoside phosphotransferase family protein [Streptomyces sp. AV19]
MGQANDRLEPPERLVRAAGATEGARQWLAGLPMTAQEYLERWELTPERVQTPGGRSSMAVLARCADGTPAVLKLALPDGRAGAELAALEHWNGFGAVRVLRAEPEAGALLLERLHGDVSLRSLPEQKALLEASATLQRLWVAPPAGSPFPSVDARTAALAEELRADTWAVEARSLVDEALEVRDALAGGEPGALLHGDYCQGKVLAADRTPWLAVSPRPLVGDRAYDLASLVRDRADTLLASPGAAAIARRRIAKLADSLDVDRERLRGWALFRSVETGVRERNEMLLEFAALL